MPTTGTTTATLVPNQQGLPTILGVAIKPRSATMAKDEYDFFVASSDNVTVIDTSLGSVKAMVYDESEECMFGVIHLDGDSKIVKRCQAANWTMEILINHTNILVENLALDYVGKHLIWIKNAHHSLEYSDYNGTFRGEVPIDMIHDPLSLRCDPEEGYIFVHTLFPPAIHRVTMTGGKHLMVYDKIYPQAKGFTLDIRRKEVYLMARFQLIKTDYHGRRSQRVAILDRSSFALLHIHSMEISESWIMWTSVTMNNIAMISLTRESDTLPPLPKPQNLGIPMTTSVKYFSILTRNQQKSTGVNNPCSNSMSCGQNMCLGDGPEQYSCFELSPEIATETVLPMSCTSMQFQCANNHCLPLAWTCNGEADCLDGSDNVQQVI
ncbi:hypothetical protein TCAL_12856 [Tigriopus californicus]|uniref:Uncharacterized protein n=1 Tax=Tigriopus californicus TaxID=6832 RepID=A0A553PKB5_TIGCA|nr:hypothetical protein TCAL_12856 [Tigriopus californicus]